MLQKILLTALLCNLMFLVGCDGHSRTLYLRQSNAVEVPWHVGRAIVEIEDDQKVLSITNSTAKKLGLFKDNNNENSWVDDTEYWNFSMSVVRVNEDLWAIYLSDWPSIGRSEVSVKAEKMIMESLIVLPNNQ